MTSRLELLPGGGRGGRRTLAETAAAELHQLILSGELPSGTPLRLVELANRLEMSQMPVREGLRRLEALGLVDIIPHRGAWVRELSLEDLRDTHETRLALESLAVRAAAEHFGAEDEQKAVAALEEHLRLSRADDSVGARQSHADFHFALYRAGGRSGWHGRSSRSGRTASATGSAVGRPLLRSSATGRSTRQSWTRVSRGTRTPPSRPCATTWLALCSGSPRR